MSKINITEDDNRNLHQVLARAANDAGYREQLKESPHAAIEQETGIRLHPDFRIRFVEKDSDLDALVVLPDFVPEQAELTEEELAAVAGGMEAEALICWDTCEKTCDKTCLLTGLSL